LHPAARGKRQTEERVTYWLESLDEYPFIVGNVILERSLRRTKAEEENDNDNQ